MKTNNYDTDLSMLEHELINRLLASRYLGQVEWEELECSINRTQDNFSHKIRLDFPMLSKDDIHIILLIRINMRNIDIARLIHILPSSFRMRRSRLKKKMEINSGSLEEFIVNLYKETTLLDFTKNVYKST